LPFGQPARRLRHRGEYDLDVRRDAHAVEVLLPRAVAYGVVHEHDEPQVERLAPADHDLPVNETVVDTVERNGHAAGVRIALPPASAARRAASAGDSARRNTNASNIASFTPVTPATSVLPRARRTEGVRQYPPGSSSDNTAGRRPAAAAPRPGN